MLDPCLTWPCLCIFIISLCPGLPRSTASSRTACLFHHVRDPTHLCWTSPFLCKLVLWSRSLETQYSAPPIFTTPPQTRKRKAPNTFDDRAIAAAKSSKREPVPQLETPTTPLTELDSPIPEPMDSEDEYLSDASSQEEEDFEGTQDSEAGSVGDGKPPSPLCCSF